MRPEHKNVAGDFAQLWKTVVQRIRNVRFLRITVVENSDDEVAFDNAAVLQSLEVFRVIPNLNCSADCKNECNLVSPIFSRYWPVVVKD